MRWPRGYLETCSPLESENGLPKGWMKTPPGDWTEATQTQFDLRAHAIGDMVCLYGTAAEQTTENGCAHVRHIGLWTTQRQR
ncbi:hypothetical protein HMPREF1527_00993 [Atopobium sp. oral taxon 199 str. F0494]|nr:hypothetical protein HMPREF1527_00993 [Atopobium sp. oral taxon 199 str. F0494]